VEREELTQFLENVPILQFLPPDVRELVIGSFVPAQYTFGQEIVKEGEHRRPLPPDRGRRGPSGSGTG
jgi:hypothetical protein